MGAVLRPMEFADLDAVMVIEEASFPAPWRRETFAQELSSSRRAWLVAEWDGRVIGYGGIQVVEDEAHVMNLAVRADARSAGIGAALLAALVDAARDLGAKRVTLEVREGNEAAVRLYRGAGFTEEGRRRGYYSESGEDALIMWSGDLSHDSQQAAIDSLRARGEAALGAYSGPQSVARVASGGEEVVLGIETSCDETAAAVLRGGLEVVSSVVASQVDFHARFGGVVPEIASRKHTEAIVGVVSQALADAGVGFDDLDAIAVTYGPGLVGALVVGVAYAKGLSLATGVSLVGVNHLEGHLFANVLADPGIEPPLVALVVSGGHTSLVYVPEWGEYEVLGETLDDAAGEAFDKVAKVLGLGYPGGPAISRLAEEGDPGAVDFPRAMMRSGDYRFSLSGLKTAVVNYIRHEREAGREIDVPDVAASFQQAVIDVQIDKSVRAALEHGVSTFCIAGGVAANTALREGLRAALGSEGISLSVPPLALCTDNAAMIAAAGTFRLRRGDLLALDAEAVPNLALG